MVDTQYLEKKIAETGKKKEYIASKIGITRQSLTNKINRKSDFTTREITALCEELDINTLSEKERIFFAK